MAKYVQSDNVLCQLFAHVKSMSVAILTLFVCFFFFLFIVFILFSFAAN